MTTAAPVSGVGGAWLPPVSLQPFAIQCSRNYRSRLYLLYLHCIQYMLSILHKDLSSSSHRQREGALLDIASTIATAAAHRGDRCTVISG